MPHQATLVPLAIAYIMEVTKKSQPTASVYIRVQKAINAHQPKEIFDSARIRDMCNAGAIVGYTLLALAQGSA